MEKEINKRKISKARTLTGKQIHKKIKVGAFIQVNAEKVNKEEKISKKDKEEKLKNNKPKVVGQFQLVVVKLPWYKKMYRSLLGFLGFYYN